MAPPLLAFGIVVTFAFSENLSDPYILTTLLVIISEIVSWIVDKYARGALIGIAGQQIQ